MTKTHYHLPLSTTQKFNIDYLFYNIWD